MEEEEVLLQLKWRCVFFFPLCTRGCGACILAFTCLCQDGTFVLFRQAMRV